MKNIKCILCCFLAFIMVSPVFAADSEMKAEATREYKIVTAMGLMEAGAPEDEVTRAAAAKSVVSMAGMLEAGIPTCSFGDVSVDNAYYKEIAIAYGQNLLLGYPDGTFHPDQAITGQEIAISMVKLAGYGPLAELKGGYPAGYIQVAQQGVVRYMTVGDKPVTYNEFAKILYNMLPVIVVEQKGSEITSANGVTIQERLHIVNLNGIVMSNASSSLYGDRSVAPGQALVGDTVIYAGKTNLEELLGYCVRVYARYDEQEDSYTAEYIEPVKTETVTVPFEALDLGINIFSENAIRYDVQDRTVHKSMKEDFVVLYNGVYCDIRTMSVFDSMCGEVLLIDSDSDGKFDVMHIFEYQDYLVDEVSAERGMIYDKFGKSIQLDFEDPNVSISICSKDGTSRMITDIYEWCVLSIYDSEYSGFSGKRLIKIIVSDEVAAGSVVGISTDNAQRKMVSVDGQEYRISPCYVESGKVGAVALGQQGSLFLNFKNEVCGFKLDTLQQLDKQYGVLVKAVLDENEEDVYYKIFTTDDTFINVKAAKKVKIDGKNYKEKERCAIFYEGAEFKRQVIKFECDAEGAVHYIDTGIRNTTESNNTLKQVYSMEDEEVKWRVGMKSFGNYYNLANSTVRFSIPKDISDYDAYGASFSLKDGDPYNIDVYIEDNPYEAAVIVVNDAFSVGLEYTDMYLVRSVTTTITEDDEPVYALSLYGKKGEIQEYAEVDVENAEAVRSGDIIAFGKNGNGMISRIEIIYDFKNDKVLYPDYGFATNYRVVCGKVYDKFGDWISIVPGGDFSVVSKDTLLESRNVSYYTAFVYNTVSKTVARASVNDIADYVHSGNRCSTVLVSDATAWPVTMIIYNYE